jgi:hypothetical protein
MAGSCEHDNKPSGSIKCWEFLEELGNWRLLEKDSAPWTYLVASFSGPLHTFVRVKSFVRLLLCGSKASKELT